MHALYSIRCIESAENMMNTDGPWANPRGALHLLGDGGRHYLTSILLSPRIDLS